MLSTPPGKSLSVIRKELGRAHRVQKLFAALDLENVLESASIAQVHKGLLRDDCNTHLAVLVQFLDGERLMMSYLLTHVKIQLIVTLNFY